MWGKDMWHHCWFLLCQNLFPTLTHLPNSAQGRVCVIIFFRHLTFFSTCFQFSFSLGTTGSMWQHKHTTFPDAWKEWETRIWGIVIDFCFITNVIFPSTSLPICLGATQKCVTTPMQWLTSGSGEAFLEAEGLFQSPGRSQWCEVCGIFFGFLIFYS